MPVGAVIGGSVLGAGASIVSGNKAANAQKQAADSASQVQQYMYDTSRADAAPYRDVGTSALYKLANMYGVPISSSAKTASTDWTAYVQNNPDLQAEYSRLAQSGNSPFSSPADYGQWHYNTYGAGENRSLAPYQTTLASQFGANDNNANDNSYGGFQESPGYQFRLDEGLKAIQRSAAARGGLNSGATMKALNNYAQNTASSEFENYANALRSMAGIGQTSTAQTSALGAQTAQSIGSNILTAGNAQASSYANTGAAINNLANNGIYAAMSGGFGGGSSGGGSSTLPINTPTPVYSTPPYYGGGLNPNYA